jgi:hypothetical protein
MVVPFYYWVLHFAYSTEITVDLNNSIFNLLVLVLIISEYSFFGRGAQTWREPLYTVKVEYSLEVEVINSEFYSISNTDLSDGLDVRPSQDLLS